MTTRPNKDYFFVRQDSDGGWSTKLGDGTVQKFIVASPEGDYRPLPSTINKYHLVGYSYAPKEGVNLGLHIAVARSLRRYPDGSDLEPFFHNFNPEAVAKVGRALAKHFDPAIVQEFDAARDRYMNHPNPPSEKEEKHR